MAVLRVSARRQGVMGMKRRPEIWVWALGCWRLSEPFPAVMVPRRAALVLLGAMMALKVPVPVPEPFWKVIQAAPVWMVQGQPAPVLTAMGMVPPVAGTVLVAVRVRSV